MMAMTVGEIAGVVGGQVTGRSDTAVTGPAFVDSRETVPGGLFVAVRGERADGHHFAARAVDAGAAAVLSQRPLGLPGIVVGDCVEALGILASHVLSRLSDITVVGITGSQGKTSCKDMVAQLLESTAPTVAANGSFNNEIGVPLTALRATETTRYLVVEMGSRGRGHIRYLASMVPPLVGVVLNVGVAHLGEFGSRLAIATAKAELVESLPADGVAVLNVDDELVRGMREQTAARVVTFGVDQGADVRLGDIHLDDAGHACLSLSYDGGQRSVTVPLFGEHHAYNAGAAAAAVLACGLPFDLVCDRLATVQARSRWRMDVTTNRRGITVINDAYNANPDSMRAALDTLAALGRRRGGRGRTFAVLGEMRELGDAGVDEHEAVGRLVARLEISRLVVVGDAARSIHLAASAEESWAGDSVCVPDRAAAADLLRRELVDGDLALVKASRAAGLEAVALALLDDQPEPAR